MRACTFERTSAVSLSDRRSAKPARTGWYRAPRSHTRPHSAMILRSFSRYHSRFSFRPCGMLLRLHSRSFSPFRLPLVGPKRRRWRLITTQSPLPVRPGLRPVPRKQQPPFAALGHSPPRYRCCKTNNLRPVPRKKERCPPRAPFPPPLFAKSPEGRPIVRLLASGESIARIAAIPPRQCLSRDEEGMH